MAHHGTEPLVEKNDYHWRAYSLMVYVCSAMSPDPNNADFSNAKEATFDKSVACAYQYVDTNASAWLLPIENYA